MDAKDIVESYYNKHLFAFLPNICNSSCDFCYIKPLKGKSSQLTKKTLINFNELACQAKEIGFDTVRITGGEPLIFSNFSEILGILKDNNLKYTLLTNGQNLNQFIDSLKFYHPIKISVSLHSVKNYSKIFKQNINIEKLFENLNLLIEYGTDVCITLLFLSDNRNEIKELITFFESKHIENVKIVYPNNYNTNLIEEFKQLSISSSIKNIRISDFQQKNCLLKDRGFISIVIDNLSVYNCCVNVEDALNRTIINSESFNLRNILLKQYSDNLLIKNLPCKTNLDICPIALKSLF